MFGVLDSFCAEGIRQQLFHRMLLTKQRLCTKGLNDGEYLGVPLPEINVYFKSIKDNKLGPWYKELTLNNFDMFKNSGLWILTLDMSL